MPVQLHPLRRLRRAVRQLDLRRNPELGMFRSRHDARRAMRRAAFRLLKCPAYLVTVIVCVVFALISTFVLRAFVAGLGLPIGHTTRNLILAVPVIAVCCGLGLWFLNRHISRLLRDELLEREIPVCVRCGYHLVNLPGPECPECGRPFDARVRAILELDKA